MTTQPPGIHASFTHRSDSGFVLSVDLQLPGQGITALFGPSGSGKTTLLRCIAGLESPEEGELSVNGQRWQGPGGFVPPHQRSVGYVFQEASLFPHLSVQGNLDYARKRAATRLPGPDDLRALDTLDIGPLLTRRPDQLSGGERQRVAIARALLANPRLLLMDEPLASLDVARKQEILPYLERLHEQLDVPMIYVSHSMDEVARLADYLVLMADGHATAQGPLAEVSARLDLPLPVDNERGVVLIGELAERDTQWGLARIALPGGSLWVRDGGDELHQSVRVRVLARDVSIALNTHDDTSILNRLPVEIDAIDASDASVALVRLTLGNDHLLARLTRKSVHTLQLQPGDKVWAQVKSAAIVR